MINIGGYLHQAKRSTYDHTHIFDKEPYLKVPGRGDQPTSLHYMFHMDIMNIFFQGTCVIFFSINNRNVKSGFHKSSSFAHHTVVGTYDTENMHTYFHR